MMGQLRNLMGQRFTRLLVIARTETGNIGRGLWLCRCDCGTELSVRSDSLTKGLSKSCGCLRAELVAKRSTTHGQKNTPEYKCWGNMKDRCFNKKNVYYKNYGGRGITVCERWLKFENFFADMGKCPKGLTLDRIDNNKNYEPLNCRWATQTEQQNNRRSNKTITYNGETLTYAQWSRRLGGNKNLISERLRHGWDVERAVSTPTVKRKRMNKSMNSIVDLNKPTEPPPPSLYVARLTTAYGVTPDNKPVFGVELHHINNGSYDLIGEEVMAVGNETPILLPKDKSGFDLPLVAGCVYRAAGINISRDWETGYIDCYDIQLYLHTEPVKELTNGF